MYDRVFIFRHVFFKAIPVCFSIQGNNPAFCLVNVALILPSKNTASWSLIPGMTWVLTIRLSLLVINKSTTFLPRVGLVISWTQPWSSRQSANFRVNSGKRHVGNRQLCFVKSREVHVSCYPDMRWGPDMWWGLAFKPLEWSLKVFPPPSGLDSKFAGRDKLIGEGGYGGVFKVPGEK